MRSFSKCRAAVRRRFSAGRRILPLLFSPVHGAPGRGCMLSLSRHPHLYMDFQTVPVCFSVPESAGSTRQSDARPLHLLLRDGHACLQRFFRCIGGIFRASVGNGFQNGCKVRNQHAVKSHLAAQDIAHQPFVGARRNAVDRVK